jgi:bifunctional non-homologous end joining protein LigD
MPGSRSSKPTKAPAVSRRRTNAGTTADEKLQPYRGKRDPAKTAEPMGSAATGKNSGLTFVIQEHHARALHWDFRLERDGVLVSWALPKGLPLDPKQNHLAVHTEDHPLEYGGFAGDIPAGEYGGGSVEIWDHGTYELEKWRDDEVIVVLNGERSSGKYVLFATGKTPDKSGYVKDWMIHRMDPAPVGYEKLPDHIAPMLALTGNVKELGRGDWAFEVKWDGVRAVTYIDGGRVRALTRNDKDLMRAFPELREVGEALGSRPAILDGELVALDANGKPSFGDLQQRLHVTNANEVRKRAESIPVTYVVFDVMHLDGRSLLESSYDERRNALASLDVGPTALVADSYTEVDPTAMLDGISKMGLEGIVAKRRDSVYSPGRRNGAWVKMKVVRAQEVVIGGWTDGRGERSGSLGALLLGIPSDGGLQYAGKVGTGFDADARTELLRVLTPLARKTSPFDGPLPKAEAAGAHFVRPSVVGEVAFGEWTGNGHLRHTSWRGLRPDKSTAEVVRES